MPGVVQLSSLPWQFGNVPRQPFGPAPGDDYGRVVEWLPATVPGDVRADLLANGRLKGLETPEEIRASEWVDERDWWYRISLPEGRDPDENVILEADGIDYYSAAWLDDRLLAAHAGMFSPQAILLSPAAEAPGPHSLRIRVWGSGALPALSSSRLTRAMGNLAHRLRPGTEYFPDRMAVPKAQYSFGWDFAPRVLTAGIWDDIRLVTFRGGYIESVHAMATPLHRGDPAPALWRIRLRVRRLHARPLAARILVAEMDGAPVARFGQDEIRGRDPEIRFEMPAARLWWPWDQGEPHLYRLTVQLVDEQGLADERSILTGVRSVARENLPDGRPWSFTVNGRHVFLRGANWVPADILPGRIRQADYRTLLGLAHEAGINFLRVWGGGLREKEAFWDECDRLGILAWQEFPLACAPLDHYPRDPAYLEILEQEARGTVRLLRNHPSLLAWCGGNEINPQREAAPLAVLEAVVHEEDGTRPWLPASPMIREGDTHDWRVWHGGAPWSRLAESEPAFLSEFGVQALPAVKSLVEMFGGPPPPLGDPAWSERKAQVSRLRYYGGPPVDESVEAAVRQSQRVQAATLQAAIEACRVRRPSSAPAVAAPRPCGGVAFWQFNEPWAAVTWSVVDRAGRPKLAYGTLIDIYRPLLLAARFPRGEYRGEQAFEAEIWLVNDSATSYETCRAEALLDGVRVWARDGIAVQGGASIQVGAFRRALSQRPAELELRLTAASGSLATNRYDLLVPLTPLPALPSRLRRWLADWLVTG